MCKKKVKMATRKRGPLRGTGPGTEGGPEPLHQAF